MGTERTPGPIDFLGHANVPKAIAVCPECGGGLFARSFAHEESGQPVGTSIDVDCVRDAMKGEHSWRQSDWQPVVDAVRKWAGATKD